MMFRSVPATLLFGIWSNKGDANLEGSNCTQYQCCYSSQYFSFCTFDLFLHGLSWQKSNCTEHFSLPKRPINHFIKCEELIVLKYIYCDAMSPCSDVSDADIVSFVCLTTHPFPRFLGQKSV